MTNKRTRTKAPPIDSLTGDDKFPELLFRVVVKVIIEEEEGRERLPVVGRPLVKTPRSFVAMHVHLAAKMGTMFLWSRSIANS